MELSRPHPTTLLAMAFGYVLMSLLLTCGCAVHVGEAPCHQYARAIEERLAECGLVDEWYRSQVARIEARCSDGFFGLTFIDGDQADECIEKVRETSCERIERGAPSCIGMVQL